MIAGTCKVDESKAIEAAQLIAQGKSAGEVVQSLGVDHRTLRRALKAIGVGAICRKCGPVVELALGRLICDTCARDQKSANNKERYYNRKQGKKPNRVMEQHEANKLQGWIEFAPAGIWKGWSFENSKRELSQRWV